MRKPNGRHEFLCSTDGYKTLCFGYTAKSAVELYANGLLMGDGKFEPKIFYTEDYKGVTKKFRATVEMVPIVEVVEIKRLKAELREERAKVRCEECKGRGNILECGPVHNSESTCWKCNGEGMIAG